MAILIPTFCVLPVINIGKIMKLSLRLKMSDCRVASLLVRCPAQKLAYAIYREFLALNIENVIHKIELIF